MNQPNVIMMITGSHISLGGSAKYATRRCIIPYGPNTSRVNRLPHGFFEKMYADIVTAEDMLYSAAQDNPPKPDEVLKLLARMTNNLKRQRSSHLGNETL